MAFKKAEFNDDEVSVFEEALVYKLGEYWQMRMWLTKFHKLARFSLKTCNRAIAIALNTISLSVTQHTRYAHVLDRIC
jgi:hypothetical protein